MRLRSVKLPHFSPTDDQSRKEEHVRPLAPGLSWWPSSEGLGERGFPAGTIPRVGLAEPHTSAPSELTGPQAGHPYLRSAPVRKPSDPQTRFRRVQAQLPSPSRRHPILLANLVRRQHLEGPSDLAGSGGAPRQATGWETEARSVPHLSARIVNTEGPRP